MGIVTKTMTASATRASEMKATPNTQYSLGFTVFFVVMVALSGAGGIMEERELGTLRRLLATPASRGQIIGGKVLGVATIAAFEAAVLVGFGALIFGVPWGNSPAAVILTLGALVLAATGLGDHDVGTRADARSAQRARAGGQHGDGHDRRVLLAGRGHAAVHAGHRQAHP